MRPVDRQQRRGRREEPAEAEHQVVLDNRSGAVELAPREGDERAGDRLATSVVQPVLPWRMFEIDARAPQAH